MGKFFSYSHDFGFTFHNTLEEAKKEAEWMIDECVSVSWDTEGIESVCYGEISGSAVMVDKEPAPNGSPLDYIHNYKLQ